MEQSARNSKAVVTFLENLNVGEVDMMMGRLSTSEYSLTVHLRSPGQERRHAVPTSGRDARVAKQLTRWDERFRGRRIVTEDEFTVMKRIALDSLPTNRRLLLAALYECGETAMPLSEFTGKISRVSKKTVERELENLAELEVVEREKKQVIFLTVKPKADGESKGVKTMKTHYRLSKKFREYCEDVGGV